VRPFHPNPPQWIGAALVGLAPLVAARWLFAPRLGDWIPGLSEIALVTPLMVSLCGAACILLGGALRLGERAAVALGFVIALLALVPTLMLAEYAFGIDLGIDLLPAPTKPTPLRPYPGRMGPNTCMALLLAAGAFTLLRAPASAPRRGLLRAAIALIGGISLSALAGHVLHLERLYRFGAANSMQPPTAVALALLTLALWQLQQRRDAHDGFERTAQSVARRALTVLALAAAAAGVGGFAIIQPAFERSQADALAMTTSTNALSLAHSIDSGLWFARSAVRPPAAALARLQQAPADAAAQQALQQAADNLIAGGASGVRFSAADGTLRLQRGLLQGVPDEPVLHLGAAHLDAGLHWRNGHVLVVEQPVLHEGRVVGRVLTEQPLPLFDRLLADIRRASDSSDVLLCSRVGDEAYCPPTRFYGQSFTVPMRDANGRVNYPINRALDGEEGVQLRPDLRGIPVLAAYTPVSPYPLGLVVKTDVATTHAPLKDALRVLGLLLLTLVVLGTLGVRWLVQPLVSGVVREQRRSRTILDSAHDGFVAIGADGCITDWNPEAARLFGWSANEALGRRLSELIIPAALRDAHEAGLARFLASGDGPLVNRRFEVPALRRDGTRFSAEMSLTAFHDGSGWAAHAFVRDITERLAAERRLAASERHLRDLSDNMPALVSQIDRELRYVFANRQFEPMLGVVPESLVGRRIDEARDPAYVAQVLPQIERVLGGAATAFESQLVVNGELRHYQQHYVPERGVDGDVRGFYSVTFDVTERRRDAERLAAAERRIRAITDNVPAMIYHVDAEQRYTFANELFERTFGGSHAPLPGKHVRDVRGDAIYRQVLPQMQAVLAGERQLFDTERVLDGVQRAFQHTMVPDRDGDGRIVGFYGLSLDVTVVREAERRLEQLARIDPLTGLANRRAFEERLEQAMARCRRSKRPMGLVFLDVDHFKRINDSLGHGGGDAVLKEFAARLEACVRVTDMAARLAGDEFVVVLEGLNHADEANLVADKINVAIRRPMYAGGRSIDVTSSIGVAYYGGTGSTDGAALCERADRALYRAKAAGRDTFAATTL
jgi:diguanylate cyclase (GGDEF)-like protein/PAS domain S-box-containing protein